MNSKTTHISRGAAAPRFRRNIPWLAALLLAFLAAALAATLSLNQAQASNGVYDTDDDKLIEISYLEQLDALRYDTDGDGAAQDSSDDAAYAAAFPVASGQFVCISGCIGYELTGDLDFNAASSYKSGTVNTAWTDTAGNGWTPIVRIKPGGEKGEGYSAILDGNNNSISNLYTKGAAPDRDSGLFAVIQRTGEVRFLGLTNVSVVGGYGNSGALVANNRGSVSNSYAKGVVSGKGNVGGLAGNNGTDGGVAGSYFSGTVSSSENYVGGLVGDNIGSIVDSYATGSVTGSKDYVGGLVGYSLGPINNSYASVAVAGHDDYVGGLLGKNGGMVSSSYADSSVNATDDYAGGFAGDNMGTIVISYAAGHVTGGGDYVGGLVGDNSGVIRSTYAIGNVVGNVSVGGLVGDNGNTVKYSLAASCHMSGQQSLGGMIGSNAASGTEVVDSYWDSAIGVLSSAAGTGKTTNELQTPTGYTGIYANWQSANGDGDVWDFGTDSQYPALKFDMNSDGTATVGEFGRQRLRTACPGAATPTPTPAPTATPTPTPTPTATPTPTPTPTATPTATPTPSP